MYLVFWSYTSENILKDTQQAASATSVVYIIA